VKVLLDGGEEGEAVAFEGNLLTLLSPRAFAPGSPIRFTVSVEEATRSFEGRTIGSRRVDGERFEVRMRFVNLRRLDRELFAQRLA
jgi:hypothetical protein